MGITQEFSSALISGQYRFFVKTGFNPRAITVESEYRKHRYPVPYAIYFRWRRSV
jgi:hypothetical protein